MKRSLPEGPVSRQSLPNIQTLPPSAPGSESSRRAAKEVSDPFRRESHRRIMRALAESRTSLTQWEISQRTDLPINVVSPRVTDLEPIWVARVKDGGRSHVKPSLRVDTFFLTPIGEARWAKANEPQTSFSLGAA